jgi:ABC-type sugar transport system ATPase subunit
VSFKVNQGEIVSLAGLVGAGRSEVARAIFGAEPYQSGEINLDGRPVRFRSPAEAIAQGLAMVPEDRKLLSLFMDMPVLFNMSIAELPRLSRMGVINHTAVWNSRTGCEAVEHQAAPLDHPGAA